MKKCMLILLALVITLSFCGCDTASNMIGTKFGVVCFNEPTITPIIKVICHKELQEKEVRIQDASFLDKMIAAIDGKTAGDDFCNCLGDYEVMINQYTFRLHTDKIVIFCNTEEFAAFTVECSEEEMKELYAIIEKAN